MTNISLAKAMLEDRALGQCFSTRGARDKTTIYRVRTVMKNLEKSWNFKTTISRSGKVLEK